MAKRKKYAKSPLLYIHQPGIDHPKAPMQSNYSTPKKQAEPTEPLAKKTNTRPLKRDDFSKKYPGKKPEIEQKRRPDESKAPTDQNVEQPKPQSNKKFNEMAISEKIDYFISKPNHIPNMKCEVKTEEKSYRGIIVTVEEDQILMQVGRRTSTTKIAIESIKEIRLIGF